MQIINLIHIGDRVVNLDEISGEEKCKIAKQLSCQALETLGYALEEEREKKGQEGSDRGVV